MNLRKYLLLLGLGKILLKENLIRHQTESFFFSIIMLIFLCVTVMVA